MKLVNLLKEKKEETQKWHVVFKTIYGYQTISDIEAKNEKEAISIAEKLLKKAIDKVKVYDISSND